MALTLHVVGAAKILDVTAVVLDQIEGQAYDLGDELHHSGSAGRRAYGVRISQWPLPSDTRSTARTVLPPVLSM